MTIHELNNKINNIKTSDINVEAKENIIVKLNEELETNNHELIKLKYEKLMRYSYDKNAQLLIRKIKKINIEKGFNLKDIFDYVIAINRENLLLCIHLGNRNIDNINLKDEILNYQIYKGSFTFNQTRLLLDINWSVVII